MNSECVRTTSAVERYSSYLGAHIAMHGSFWDFLQVIRQNEFQKYVDFKQLHDGVSGVSQTPKKRNRDRSEQIKILSSKLKYMEINTKSVLQMMTKKINSLSPTIPGD